MEKTNVEVVELVEEVAASDVSEMQGKKSIWGTIGKGIAIVGGAIALGAVATKRLFRKQIREAEIKHLTKEGYVVIAPNSEESDVFESPLDEETTK